MNLIKTLLKEASENLLVAASLMFLFIAFFAALAEPKASLLPFVISVGCYLLARFKDQD